MEQAGEAGGRRGTGRGSGADAHGAAGALVVVKHEPFNAEAPLTALQAERTPAALFYVRSHYPVPALTAADWRLRVEGLVEAPLTLSLADLQALPAATIAATLECAGNDRLGLAPLPPGEPWGSGAVSTATWRGVPLAQVLEQARLDTAVVEILFEGADHGVAAGAEPPLFARALPRAVALHPDTLLAYEMNGAPLPAAHGGPVRLLVPDWYAVASVKWLARIAALDAPFTGFFQQDRYVLDVPGRPVEPLRAMRVKSLITDPASGTPRASGRQRIAGMAWSGSGPITRVEVSVEPGGPWQPAHLGTPAPPHAWQPWDFAWDATQPGRHVVRVRATDTAGNTQPEVAPWNRLGYANNAIQALVLEIG